MIVWVTGLKAHLILEKKIMEMALGPQDIKKVGIKGARQEWETINLLWHKH